MTLDALVARVDSLVVALEGELQREMETVALTGLAMLQTRITEEGTDFSGRLFRDYSTTKLPLFFFTQKSELPLKGQVFDGPKVKGKRRKKVGLGLKYPKGITYAEYKQEVGRYRGFVDFTLTGEMFRRIGIVEQKNEAGKFVVRVGARDDLNQDKMIWNDLQRPRWFTLSQEEKTILRDQSQERLTAIAKRFLE